MNILLVEDSSDLAEAMCSFLSANGHIINWAPDIKTAEKFILSCEFTVVILDLSLPDGDGIDFLKNRLKKLSPPPGVIITTARDQINQRILGLNTGADDYLVKPFDLLELEARIHSLYRRFSNSRGSEVTLGKININIQNRTVSKNSVVIPMTAKEWAILERLCKNPNQLTNKDELMDAMYSFESNVESNTIEVHISQIRKKLGASVIETVRGIGYRLGQN